MCQKPSFNHLTHPGCTRSYTIDGVFTGISYNSVAKKLIYNFKYQPYVTDLKKFLVKLLYESLIQNEDFQKIYQREKGDIVFVPIPLHSNKLKARGFNQSEIISKLLSKKLGGNSVPALFRVKKTESQARLSQEERKKNISRAFLVWSQMKPKIEGKTIFLIDDILTSGSTFLEGARMLKREGAAKVYGLSLFREQ